MKYRNESAFNATVVALLLFMAIWVFVWPSSYWAGWWPTHDAALKRVMDQPGIAAPTDVFSKYTGHTAVKLTHLLPSGVWSVCGALQLLPGLRIRAPRIHRVSGRIMLGCSVLIIVGYFLIETRGLVTRTASNGEAGIRPADLPSHHLVLRLASAWFALTAAIALVTARRHQYKPHQRWALRHIASGAWVIVQRLIVLCVTPLAAVSKALRTEPERHEAFFQAATAAILICAAAPELYFWAGATRGQTAAVPSGTRSGKRAEGQGGRLHSKED